MNLRVEDGRLFRTLIKAVVAACDIVPLDVYRDGLSIQSLDSAAVCLVNLVLKKEFFSHFESSGRIKLFVPGKLLVTILSGIKKPTPVELTCVEDDLDVLTVKYYGEECIYELRTMDVEQDGVEISGLKGLSVDISHKYLKEVIGRLENIGGDTVTLKASPKIWTLSSKSVSVSMKNEIKSNGESVVFKSTLPENGPKTLEVEVGTKYFAKFVKIGNVSNDTVNLLISLNEEGEEGYLRVSYELTHGKLEYYIAPKLNDNDMG